jgi:hypothetical protein
VGGSVRANGIERYDPVAAFLGAAPNFCPDAASMGSPVMGSIDWS